MRKKVETVLNQLITQLRPEMQRGNANIKLLGVENGIVRVIFSCPTGEVSDESLALAWSVPVKIKKTLMEQVPELKNVVVMHF